MSRDTILGYKLRAPTGLTVTALNAAAQNLGYVKQLRLPTIGAEFEKLAREAADADEGHTQYLLRLTELEVAA